LRSVGQNVLQDETKESKEKIMHDIDKPITLEDLTNPDKD
jgi:hypothetical protein